MIKEEKGNFDNCYLSDVGRMDIIQAFLDEAAKDPTHNESEPELDGLLDLWDGYPDQAYVQNNLANNEIIFYEGWSSPCWNGAYSKPEYKGMKKPDVIESIIKNRFPRIAEEFDMIITDSEYWLQETWDDTIEDGYIMKITMRKNNYVPQTITENTIVKPGRFIYHRAKVQSRDKIETQGLIPDRGIRWLSNTHIDGKAIFATNSSNQKKWFDTTFDDDVWQIDTSKIPNAIWKQDPNFDSSDKHIYTHEPIPRSALNLVYVGSGRDMLFELKSVIRNILLKEVR